MRLTLLLLLLLTSTKPLELDRSALRPLESWIEAQTAGIAPGVAVGIVQDGEIVYETYAGYANLEHGAKIGPETRFNIASNAKQFTALCALELAREGVIALDQDIRKYIPELYADSSHSIAVSNLLDHTSGIRDVYDLWSLQGKTWWKLFLDNADALELLTAQQDLNFEVGSEHAYSNSNYLLLAEIVQRATGQSFHEYAASMFERAGMNQTVFLSNAMAVVPDRAAPYGNWNGWKQYPTITSLHGDGALFTTLGDQLLWETILQSQQAPGFDADLIVESQGGVPGSLTDRYGFGVTFDTYKGLDCVYHEGNTGAYNATFLRFPSERLAIVVMSNNGSLSTAALARAYADAVLGEEKLTEPVYPTRPATLEEKPTLAEIVGVYEMSDGTIATVTDRRGKVFLQVGSQDSVRLAHGRGNLYRHASARDRKLSFSSEESKGASLTIFRSEQEPSVGMRLTAGPIEADYPRSIEGRYLNSETETEIVLRHREGDEYDVIKNGRARVGTLVVRDRLRERSRTLRIDRDDEGRVRGLRVDGNRIRNVWFEKTDA